MRDMMRHATTKTNGESDPRLEARAPKTAGKVSTGKQIIPDPEFEKSVRDIFLRLLKEDPEFAEFRKNCIAP